MTPDCSDKTQRSVRFRTAAAAAVGLCDAIGTLGTGHLSRFMTSYVASFDIAGAAMPVGERRVIMLIATNDRNLF